MLNCLIVLAVKFLSALVGYYGYGGLSLAPLDDLYVKVWVGHE